MQKRMLMIFNALAGKKQGKKYLADILEVFSKKSYECTVHLTTGQGNAREVASQKCGDYDLIVCVGGDGTFNEVVSGVINANITTPIGYIPAGSTNDFANSLKLSKNMVMAAKDIVNGTPHKIDTGEFCGRPFTYVASFGAFTKASYSTPQNVKNALGHLAYVLEGIKEIGAIRPIPMKVEIENEVIEGDFIFGAVSNSTSIGGILSLDKNIVDISDGLLEILLIKSPNNLIDLNECISALTTQNYNSRMLIFRSAKEMVITSPTKNEWTLDGEYQEGLENITIKNIHNSVNLIVKNM